MFEHSIVHRLVCPSEFLQGVQLPLRQHFKNVWPGTPATLSLIKDADGSAEKVLVSWPNRDGVAADVMTIDEAQDNFMEPAREAA